MEACLRPASSTHFMPEVGGGGGGFFVSSVVLSGIDEADHVESRRLLQKALMLPEDRPIFRSGNAYEFAEEIARSPYLRNVHLGLKNPLPQSEKPNIGLVQGNYVYHHYLQVRCERGIKYIGALNLLGSSL